MERKEIEGEQLLELRDELIIPNGAEPPILEKPSEMFFENRAGLASKFENVLDWKVIVRPQGAWRAMEAVGVRRLSEVVDVNFVEPPEAVPNTRLKRWIDNRRQLLARVIEAENSAAQESMDGNVLDALTFLNAEQLKVVYSIQLSRLYQTKPESIHALYNDEEKKLYAVRDGETWSWVAVARELATAIKQSKEIGGLAGGLKEVLATERLATAERLLDELGYPPLKELPKYVLSMGRIENVGGEKKPSEPDEDYDGDALADILDVEDTPGRSSTQASSPDESPAVGTRSGNGLQERGKKPKDKARKIPPRGKKIEREGTMLLSYVFSTTENGEKGDGAKRRAAVDSAGIERVLAYEESHDRKAQEMEHHNVGYDVESKEPDGTIRYIEVKSLSGYWSAKQPARITRAQFEMAREKGPHFWLYVVERAKVDDEYKIYAIHNPANRIDRYAFDAGWMKVIEEAGPEQNLSEERLEEQK